MDIGVISLRYIPGIGNARSEDRYIFKFFFFFKLRAFSQSGYVVTATHCVSSGCSTLLQTFGGTALFGGGVRPWLVEVPGPGTEPELQL